VGGYHVEPPILFKSEQVAVFEQYGIEAGKIMFHEFTGTM